jgi:aldehyde:ferredoxin oxidoreductase
MYPLESEPHLNCKLLVMDGTGKPVSRKGAISSLEDFEQLKDEYYQLRGWNVATGMPMWESLRKLGLQDVTISI